MQAAGQQLLARTALAHQQHREVAGRHLAEVLKHPAKSRRWPGHQILLSQGGHCRGGAHPPLGQFHQMLHIQQPGQGPFQAGGHGALQLGPGHEPLVHLPAHGLAHLLRSQAAPPQGQHRFHQVAGQAFHCPASRRVQTRRRGCCMGPFHNHGAGGPPHRHPDAGTGPRRRPKSRAQMLAKLPLPSPHV